MTDQVAIAIWTGLPPTLLAAAALWKVIVIDGRVDRVHKELNSRLTQWREETKQATIASNAAAKAEGVKETEDKGKVEIKGQ
jgi:hypothetical protein